MQNTPDAARTSPIVSDERIKNKIRHHIDLAINIDRTTTRQQLAKDSRVNIHCIDAILSRDPAKKRRVAAEDLMSLAFVLGDEAVNSFLSCMGYGGAERLDEPEEIAPMALVADAMTNLAVIATCTAEGSNHVNEPARRAAAERVIHDMLVIAGAGRPE